MTSQRSIDLSTPAGQVLGQISGRLRNVEAGGGWTGADLVTILASVGARELDWIPELGTVVQLRSRVTAGYIARSGTVVGCGAVHPADFPYNNPNHSSGPDPVVLVTTGELVAAWGLGLIEPGICIFHTGHTGACAAGTPQWTDPRMACRRSTAGRG